MSALSRPKTCEAKIRYCKFGSDALLKLLQTFKDQIGGVVESQDIEYVHKMRVTTRRIRATMPLFRTCFPKKKFGKWLRQIKEITRLLGEARDLDVQIVFVQTYMQKLNGPESTGLELLAKSQKNRRKAIQETVTNGLKGFSDSGVLEEIDQFLAETAKELSGVPFDSSSVLEKSYWHISSRLDDFLSLEECVHQEKAIAKHHEMRIKAKLLRYTMETFAPIYKNQLTEEIQTIKDFQDVLGETHDLDVWIDYLPKFNAKLTARRTPRKKGEKKATAAQSKRALLNFLAYIKDLKKNRYEEFVGMWEQKKAEGFFDKLQETANGELNQGKAKVNIALAKPNVKIAVMSDIHANLHALEAVIQDAQKRGADVFLNAGDSIGFGAFPNEVIELLYSRNVVNVLGNFDCEVIGGTAKNEGVKRIAVEFARKELSKSCRSNLVGFPPEVSLQVADMKLLMVHGSLESMDDHIYSDTPIERLNELAEEADADLIVVGHSHEQFNRQARGISFLNPGSVGRPGDGNPQTAYALLSFEPFNVELIRIDYDEEAAANALRKKKLPESFAQMLLRGLPVEAIVQEDEEKKDNLGRDCRKTSKACSEISKDYWKDSDHQEQVRKLGLEFFDKLERLHLLGKRERCWLECAAILHDVGLSESTKGHHKKSMKIILNDTRLPFASNERRIIASIARYHRKGLPKRKHYNLATLNRKTIAKVLVLSSLLRIADALDYSHQSVIKCVEVKCSPKQVNVEYVAASQSPLEEEAFNKKKELFENVFKKQLVLGWKQQ